VPFRNSFLFHKEPGWKNNRPDLRQQIPAQVKSWIYETGSLTQRLRKQYPGQVQVKILFHQWKPAFPGECTQLRLDHHRFQLVREVLLHANQTPLILARTILPEKTIKIAKRNLSHLGTRPLGEVIFAYPNLERGQLQISCIPSNNWSSALHQDLNLPDNIWGRRTVYQIQQHPLLVSEFFLPGALSLPQPE
jgi:chorismate--pyruvate lyase